MLTVVSDGGSLGEVEVVGSREGRDLSSRELEGRKERGRTKSRRREGEVEKKRDGEQREWKKSARCFFFPTVETFQHAPVLTAEL